MSYISSENDPEPTRYLNGFVPLAVRFGAEAMSLHRDGYVLAASVLDSFDPDSLVPFPGGSVDAEEGPTPEPDLARLLEVAIVKETDDGKFIWRLPDDLRRQALRILGKRDDLRRALALNDRNDKSTYQQVFERYVAGDMLPLDEHPTLDDLQASLQAIRLLRGIVPGLPDEQAVTALAQREAFLQQFRVLADKHFVGRVAEFRKLERFVDTLPTSSLQQARRAAVKFASSFKSLEGLAHAKPILIHGVGGIGKSAFLSKFLLDYIERASGKDFAFAYIDFDRATILQDEPLSILAEIAAQMAMQVPACAAGFTQLQQDILRDLSGGHNYNAEFDSLESINNASQSERRESRHLSRYKNLMASAFPASRTLTLLLVYDTFEEVTQRAGARLLVFWKFLEELREITPWVRVILAGRTELPPWIARERLDLDMLHDADAAQLLRSYGVEREDAIATVVERVHGHPLSLKLTVQLIDTIAKRAGKRLDEVSGDELFGSEWDEHLAEGILYRRFIDHIPDPLVQRLANPGFVLRELTPRLILDVLNVPCELGLHTEDEARMLFERLAMYSSLVSQRSEWVLRHRPEVRSMLLELMVKSEPELCRSIRESAARFYAGRDSLRARAEEIYCLMMLDTPPDILSQRWQSGVEKYLASARDELPPRARDLLDYQTLLAESGRTQANELQGDVRTLRQAEEMKLLLARGSPRSALAKYKEFAGGADPEPSSPLFVLVTRALAQAGKASRALKLVQAGLQYYESEDRTEQPDYLDLLLLMCQLSMGMDARPMFRSPGMRAEELWRRFEQATQDLPRNYQVFRVAVHILELTEIEIGRGLQTIGAVGAEAAPKPDVERYALPADPLYRACLDRVRTDIETLRFGSDDVDAMLLLRAFGSVAPYFPDNLAVRGLLALGSLQAILVAEFGDLWIQLLQAGKQLGLGKLDTLAAQLRDIDPHLLWQLVERVLSNRDIVHFALLVKQEIIRRNKRLQSSLSGAAQSKPSPSHLSGKGATS